MRCVLVHNICQETKAASNTLLQSRGYLAYPVHCLHLKTLRMTTMRMAVEEHHARNVKENQERLVPIIKTSVGNSHMSAYYALIWELPSEPVQEERIRLISMNPYAKSDVKFELLPAYSSDGGDLVLEHHLKAAGHNATHVSKTIQNELILICGQIVT